MVGIQCWKNHASGSLKWIMYEKRYQTDKQLTHYQKPEEKPLNVEQTYLSRLYILQYSKSSIALRHGGDIRHCLVKLRNFPEGRLGRWIFEIPAIFLKILMLVLIISLWAGLSLHIKRCLWSRYFCLWYIPTWRSNNYVESAGLVILAGVTWHYGASMGQTVILWHEWAGYKVDCQAYGSTVSIVATKSETDEETVVSNFQGSTSLKLIVTREQRQLPDTLFRRPAIVQSRFGSQPYISPNSQYSSHISITCHPIISSSPFHLYPT